MTQLTSPFLDAAYGWDFGEGGWNTGMDQNLLKFSFMFDRNVDSIVASLPPAVNGQAHYLTADNRLYFAVGTTYFSTIVPKWFTVVVRSTGATWQYNGTTLSQIENTIDLDTRLDVVELTIASLGSAAFQDVSAFATQGELDVVEGQSQTYTDALRSDINIVIGSINSEIVDITSAGFLKQQNESMYALSEETIGDTTAFDTAIRSGVVRIAFAGDSIFEGLSQITYEDSPVGVIMRALREQNPGVVFTVGNFSLAGRGIGELASPTYVGIASPDNPATGFYHADSGPVYGLWPGGSVIGKSWLAHVRDFAPDLFVIAHGMNNISGDGAAFAALLKSSILDVAAGWTKPPSIALVATMLPSTTVSPFDTLQDEIQTTADVMRGVAQERNASLYDANRRYLLLRDAVDVGNKKRKSDVGFSGYPTGWAETTGGFAKSGNVLTGAGVTRRKLVADDCHVSAVFTLANYATQTPGIWYRVEGSNQYTVQIASGTTAILYYNGVPFASQAFPALTNGVPVRLEIDITGARHRVYVDGVLRIDVYDYKRLRPGMHMLQIDGASGTISDYSAQLGSNFAIGTPQFTEAELLGVADWLTNPDSIGGNAINHPSKLAATMVYGVAMSPLLRQAKRAKLGGTTDVILATANDSVTTFDAPANQSLSVRINGVGGLEGLAVSTGAGAAIAVAESTKLVTGGLTIVVDAVLSTTGAVLPVNVALPAGRWSVRAMASFSRNGSGYRNYISVEATRIK